MLYTGGSVRLANMGGSCLHGEGYNGVRGGSLPHETRVTPIKVVHHMLDNLVL